MSILDDVRMEYTETDRELKHEPVINRSQVKRAVAALEKIAEHLETISLHLYSTQESVSDLADSVAVIETRTEQNQ